MASWEGTRARYRAELRELEGRRDQLVEERQLHAIHAPVAGTVSQLVNLSPGSFVVAGQRLMVISPAADLIAELYVESRDIAHVAAGMPVRMQVDAFNYSDWGLLEGEVLDMSEDVVLMDERPVYRVRASIGEGRLRLPDGASGVVQKGMAVQARFSMGRRSLMQLLRDDLRSGLDPFAPDTISAFRTGGG